MRSQFSCNLLIQRMKSFSLLTVISGWAANLIMFLIQISKHGRYLGVLQQPFSLDLESPALYLLLNHNLIEAFGYGAVAQVKVEGKGDSSLMKVVHKQNPLQ